LWLSDSILFKLRGDRYSNLFLEYDRTQHPQTANCLQQRFAIAHNP